MSGRGPRDPNREPGGGASSYDSKMVQHIAESAASVTGEATIDLSELPQVELPDLSDISITVPAPEPITEEEVMSRFEQLYYKICVERNVREPGEPIEMGDEILVDLLGYLEGRIIPFSASKNLIMMLEPDVFQPGFGTTLEGTAVGETKVITVPITDTDEFGAPRELTAAFVVEIKGAASLNFPEPDSPETLAKLSMGPTLDDVYRTIAETINEERANLLVVTGMNMALKAASEKIDTPIPTNLIEDQIKAFWQKREGRFLVEKGLPRHDIDQALEAWLQNEEVQEEARQRLRVSMLVLSYARQDEQDFQEEELIGFVEEFAKSAGIELETWRAATAENERAQLAIIDSYLYIRTVSHIVADIPITYAE